MVSCVCIVKVLAARHLTQSKRGIVSPYVEVEIIGSQQDMVSNKYATKMIGMFPHILNLEGKN